MKFLRDSEYQDLSSKLEEAMTKSDNVAELTTLVETVLDQVIGQIDSFQWQSLTQGSTVFPDMPAQERTQLLRIARQYWLKDPLIHQAVRLNSDYTFGDGLNYRSSNDDLQRISDQFWWDEDNQMELTSPQAQMQKGQELQVDGEIFFIIFKTPSGTVKVRTLPPEEIVNVITSPDDHRRSLYYERRYVPQTYDFGKKMYVPGTSKVVYYADWHNYAVGKWGFEQNLPTLEPGLIYHVAVNRIGWQRRGYTETYAALDWVKAHRQMLQDWVTIVKAYSTLAWKAKIKGDDARDLDRIKTKLQAIMPAFNAIAGQPAAPAGAGGVAFENDDVTLSPMKTAGMATNPADSRQIRLMAGAGLGIFEHYFGDGSNSNLATATAMEGPMLRMFTAKQRLWEGIYSTILDHNAISAADAGQLPGIEVVEEHDDEGRITTRRLSLDDGHRNMIAVTAPPILQADLDMIGRAIPALLMSGAIPQEAAARYTLEAMDIPNSAEMVDEFMKNPTPIGGPKANASSGDGGGSGDASVSGSTATDTNDPSSSNDDPSPAASATN